jgi:Cu+-exporting ATPase
LASIIVLVASCPCALGIAVPLTVMVGINSALKKGILYTNINVFEKLKKIKVICFDKTNTLTTTPVVENFMGDLSLLSLLFSLEMKSNHPIAKAIINTYQQQYPHLKLLLITNVQETPHFGISGIYQSQSVTAADLTTLLHAGHVLEFSEVPSGKFIALSINQKIMLLVQLKSVIHEDNIKLLKNLIIKKYLPVLVTGDKEENSSEQIQQLPFKQIFFNQTPFQKQEIVKKFQKQGHQVVFIGDGINDALALKQADVGISITDGSALAIQSSDILLLNNNLMRLEKAFQITKKTT